MSTDCIFCKIVAGEIPCSKVHEDEHTLAFLDISPAVEGHTLVIPKEHCTDLPDAPTEVLEACMTTAARITRGLKGWGADGVNLLQNNGPAAGQVVFHIHFHLFPRYKDDQRPWGWKGSPYPKGRAEELQAELVKAIEESGDRDPR